MLLLKRILIIIGFLTGVITTSLFFIHNQEISFGAPATNITYQKSLLPITTDTYDLGSTTPNLEWNNLFAKNVTVSGTCTGCGAGGGGGGNSKWATSTLSSLTIYPNGTTNSIAVGTSTAYLQGGDYAQTLIEASSTNGIPLFLLGNNAGQVGDLFDIATSSGGFKQFGNIFSISGAGTFTLSSIGSFTLDNFNSLSLVQNASLGIDTNGNFTITSGSQTKIASQLGVSGNITATSTGTSTLNAIQATALTAWNFLSTGYIRATSSNVSSFVGNLGVASSTPSSTLGVSGTSTLDGVAVGLSGLNLAGSKNCEGTVVLASHSNGDVYCGTNGVTSISSGTGLTGGTITTTGTIALDLTLANNWTSIATTTYVGGIFSNTGITGALYGIFGYIKATSTTATSTFANGIILNGGAFTDTQIKSCSGSGLTVLTNSNGDLTCSAITGVPNTSLANSTISGISLGSNLNSLSNDGATLSGTSYNGSAAVSNWAINLGATNKWTGVGTTTWAGSMNVVNNLSSETSVYAPLFNATSTIASSTVNNLVVANGFSAPMDKSIAVATSTLNYLNPAFGAGTGSTTIMVWSPSTSVTVTRIKCNLASNLGGFLYVEVGNGTATSTATKCTGAGSIISGVNLSVTQDSNLYVRFGSLSGTPDVPTLTVTYK